MNFLAIFNRTLKPLRLSVLKLRLLSLTFVSPHYCNIYVHCQYLYAVLGMWDSSPFQVLFLTVSSLGHSLRLLRSLLNKRKITKPWSVLVRRYLHALECKFSALHEPVELNVTYTRCSTIWDYTDKVWILFVLLEFTCWKWTVLMGSPNFQWPRSCMSMGSESPH